MLVQQSNACCSFSHHHGNLAVALCGLCLAERERRPTRIWSSRWTTYILVTQSELKLDPWPAVSSVVTAAPVSCWVQPVQLLGCSARDWRTSYPATLILLFVLCVASTLQFRFSATPPSSEKVSTQQELRRGTKVRRASLWQKVCLCSWTRRLITKPSQYGRSAGQ